MIRREFLKSSVLASGVALFPRFLKAFDRSTLVQNGKKLVVIQLSGGNDGLNTVIPFRNDIYYQQRPALAIGKESLLPLTDEAGLHTSLPSFRALYNQGELTIVNQVGYPNAERSHFRAMDIWHTGSSANEYWQTGWLGRYLDHNCQGCSQPHKVVEIDDTLSLAVKGEQTHGLAVKDPQKLYKTVQDPHIQGLYQVYRSKVRDRGNVGELDFLYKTVAETVESADHIHQKARIISQGKNYPISPIGRQLKVAGELISSGIDTSVYYVSHTGFDTHVRQIQQHERLLKQLDEALGAFVDNMKKQNQWNDIRVLIFSEFGRRVAQNASIGTDHGKANNVFLLGGSLGNPGMYNDLPTLKQLDDGDVPFQVDFRSIYAAILRDWLQADDVKILQRSYDRIQIV